MLGVVCHVFSVIPPLLLSQSTGGGYRIKSGKFDIEECLSFCVGMP